MLKKFKEWLRVRKLKVKGLRGRLYDSGGQEGDIAAKTRPEGTITYRIWRAKEGRWEE